MRRIPSDDGQTIKYIHDSGLETTIKKKLSCNGVYDPQTNSIKYSPTTKPYYTVFMSSSVGCRMLCGFCYLTALEMDYKPISAEVLVQAVLSALKEENEHDPTLRTKLVKLSWMGMGEEFSAHPTEWVNTTKTLIRLIMDNQLAGGLVGCDVATVFPKSVNWDYFYTRLAALNSWIINSPFCIRISQQPMVRVFWSIPVISSGLLRTTIMPGTGTVSDIVAFLNDTDQQDIQVVLHHFFIKGINDHQKDLDALIKLIKSINRPVQLRLLRFNRHPTYKFPETPLFESCVIYLAKRLDDVRVQESAGSDIKAACGMFGG